MDGGAGAEKKKRRKMREKCSSYGNVEEMLTQKKDELMEGGERERSVFNKSKKMPRSPVKEKVEKKR